MGPDFLSLERFDPNAGYRRGQSARPPPVAGRGRALWRSGRRGQGGSAAADRAGHRKRVAKQFKSLLLPKTNPSKPFWFRGVFVFVRVLAGAVTPLSHGCDSVAERCLLWEGAAQPPLRRLRRHLPSRGGAGRCKIKRLPLRGKPAKRRQRRRKRAEKRAPMKHLFRGERRRKGAERAFAIRRMREKRTLRRRKRRDWRARQGPGIALPRRCGCQRQLTERWKPSDYLISCSKESNSGVEKNSPSVIPSPSHNILIVTILGFLLLP